MAVLELEFQNFLKESRDLHEKLYPGSLFLEFPLHPILYKVAK